MDSTPTHEAALAEPPIKVTIFLCKNCTLLKLQKHIIVVALQLPHNSPQKILNNWMHLLLLKPTLSSILQA